MTPSVLRYQASRDWMERQLLAGRPLNHRRQRLEIDSAKLSDELRSRLEHLLDAASYLDEFDRVLVLDSGIDPVVSFGPDKDALTPLDDRVVSNVGSLPELSKPTDDVAAVIDAWEKWLDRYREAALETMEHYINNPPKVGWDTRTKRPAYLSGVALEMQGYELEIARSDGAQAMQDIRAGLAWLRRANKLFSGESVGAAREATGPAREEVQEWFSGSRQDFAKGYWLWAKRFFVAAKAHDRALNSEILGFDEEMERWASERGSERLRLGIADGYRMNARYLTERLAVEAPGFYAMPTRSATEGWAKRANSPSENALRMRRAVEVAISKSAPMTLEGPAKVEIYDVIDPPVEIFVARGGSGQWADLPHPKGWDWSPDDFGGTSGRGPNPFEAVVVHNWLGRFMLIGAVRDNDGEGPPWIWAVPEPQRFRDDGTVEGEDPDAERRPPAKRKPPGPGTGDDDIPF
jgi:hypothetical protein